MAVAVPGNGNANEGKDLAPGQDGSNGNPGQNGALPPGFYCLSSFFNRLPNRLISLYLS